MRIVHGGMLPAGLLQISSGFTRAIAGDRSPRDRRRLKTLGLMLSLSGAPYLALGARLIGGQADTPAGAVFWGAGFVIVALGHLAAGLFLLRREPRGLPTVLLDSRGGDGSIPAVLRHG